MSRKIIFRQEAVKGVTDSYTKEFISFGDVRKWVMDDKLEGYGDVLLPKYGGIFEGLTDDEEDELRLLTYEDALLEDKIEQDLRGGKVENV